MAKEKKEKKPKLTKEEKQALKEEQKAEKERQKEEKKAEIERQKEEKRLDKLRAKAKKRGKRFDPNDPEWEDEEGGSLLIAIVAFMIILVWLGIVAALVKLDVGGIGSTILYPVLKDVPVINYILPGIEPELKKQAAEREKKAREKARQRAVEEAKEEAKKEIEVEQETENARFKTVEEATAEVERLEALLNKEKKTRNDRTAEIADLRAQIEQLQTYKDDVDNFEKKKEKFYNEVVFSEEAPDIKTYKEYYESIEPENAEQIYRQIIEQQQTDNKIKEYATTYSTMEPTQAAAIFDTMPNNLKLVAKILNAMSAEQKSAILAAMEKENAARLTELMQP